MAMATSLGRILALALFCSISASASANTVTSPKAPTSYVIDGRVKVEGMGAKLPLSKTANIKVILNGGQRLTFIRPDGYFAFQGVTAGTHLLEVVAMGYYFSPANSVPSPRFISRIRTIIGLLKSPMGLMVGFMLVAVFLLPKLMDSIDPEEMKRVQEEMRNQPAPSFSNLLQGRS